MLGLQTNFFDLKKDVFATRYENTYDLQVITHSLSFGIKAEIEKEFKKTPLSLSAHYYSSKLVGSLVGDNKVDLVKDPIEQVFLVIFPPRERNITSVRELTLTLKTTLLSTRIRRRSTPGIYLNLSSGIGLANYEGQEITFLDPPFQVITDWKEQHTSLNLGGELVLLPSKKSEFLSFFLAIEKKYLLKPQRLEKPIVAFGYGFKMSF